LRHSPDPQDVALAAVGSLRGGEQSKRNKIRGLGPDELPVLSPETAQEWCATIGKAVLGGRISATQAQSGLRAVSEVLRAAEATDVRERIAELQRKISSLKNGRGENGTPELSDRL